jgi:diacylglycerol O-acyltransferase / wax synthase
MARERMSHADAAWLHMDRPHNLMVINSVMWFDEPVPFDTVREITRERLVERYPRFRQRVVEGPLPLGGAPEWEDDPDFDLDHHVRRRRLAAPGDKAALQRYVAEQMSVPLDRARPLWTVEVLDGYQGGSAVVTRMHHCIADGIALSRVLLEMTDEFSGVAFAAAEEPAPRRVVDLVTRPAAVAGDLLHEGLETLLHPSRLVALGNAAAADLTALGKLLLLPPDHRGVLHAPNAVPKTAAWSDPLPLAEVKAIGRITGTTVNDVVLAALSGAFRRYVEAHGGQPRDVRVIVPYNLRPLDQPLPRTLGNMFGLVFLSLPVGTEDPQLRLVEMHRRMDAIKHSAEGPVSFGVLGVTGATPHSLESLIVDVFTAKGSAVVTNVPGPPEPVRYGGTPIRGVVSWVPRAGNIGTGVSIFSYCGEVTVGFSTDAGLVPEPQDLVDALVDELALLREAVGAPASA